MVARGWLRPVWERVEAPAYTVFRETARFRRRAFEIPNLRDALMSPDMVRRRGKRYAYTTGPVTVIGIGKEKMLTLIAVVVRDPARSGDV